MPKSDVCRRTNDFLAKQSYVMPILLPEHFDKLKSCRRTLKGGCCGAKNGISFIPLQQLSGMYVGFIKCMVHLLKNSDNF